MQSSQISNDHGEYIMNHAELQEPISMQENESIAHGYQ